LRPHCEPCAASKGRDHAIIAHPAGEETQWDWVELPDPPASWNAGGHAHLLVGALSHSGLWRGVLAEAEDLAHLVEAIDKVVARLGGVTRRWRFDRMSTVCAPSGRLSAGFAAVAKHYQVAVDVCPARHGNRKGVVEKANHGAAQRWWRTLRDDVSPAQAQLLLDARAPRFDARRRMLDGAATTVGALAAVEGLRPAPAEAYPAQIVVERIVSPQALVSFRGNQYSVPPGMSGTTVLVRHRLGGADVTVAAASGAVIAQHRRAGDGAGALIRAQHHVTALETAVLKAFSDGGAACKHKIRRPPSQAAVAEAARLRGGDVDGPADRVVIDMAAYTAAAAALTHTGPGHARAAGDNQEEHA